ncbi:NAD(P)-dependent oxidoreductase [Alphaproteobacteria bacterium]|nr:NAD(P)-dependent oxidoreductase [Alphaproteobacteria bacterium]
MHYGFIGLGNLGGRLALSLLKSGFSLTIFDKDEALCEPVQAEGAMIAPDGEALAENVDHIITCLPSPAISRQVMQKCLPKMAAGASWIEMSTISREDVINFSEMAKNYNVEMLELPVTGGVHLAARGEITMLAGGDKALFELHYPALQAMGNKIFHIGPLGSAAVIKVITNMLAFIHLVADGEALMLAQKGGIDLDTAWQVIAASSGNSFVHETEGQLILNGSYNVGFTMDLALKDLGFASQFSQEFGVPLNLVEKVKQIFEEGKNSYGGQAQSTQIVKLLEDALDTDLRADGYPSQLE